MPVTETEGSSSRTAAVDHLSGPKRRKLKRFRARFRACSLHIEMLSITTELLQCLRWTLTNCRWKITYFRCTYNEIFVASGMKQKQCRLRASPSTTNWYRQSHHHHDLSDHWCLFNDFLLANRSLLVFPIRNRPVQNLAQICRKKKCCAVLTRARADSVFGNLPDRVFPSITQPATPSHLQHSQKES